MNPKMFDNGMAQRISIEYTMTAARLFNESCQRPFRFVYCSSYLAEGDQTKRLLFFQNYRRMKVSFREALINKTTLFMLMGYIKPARRYSSCQKP